MSGQDLYLELQNKMSMLDKAVTTLARNGQRLAQAEQNYRIALAEKILTERDKGLPVTIIGDVCRGDREIAKLKFERDTAQAVYDANSEAINVWKVHARVLENQISREWGRKD